MDWNLKKMWPAAAASLVAVTSCLSAADDMQTRNLENRISALEKRGGAGGGMLNPSSRPGVRDGSDVFITAAALYWKPNETGLSYAIQENGPNHNFADCGKVLESRGKYHWGFKVGLGYNMPHDGWDLYLNWTHFRANNKHFDCCEECEDDCDECDDCGNCNQCEPRTNSCSNECGECNECNECEREPCPNIMFPVTVDFAADTIPAGAWNCDAFSRWKLHIDMLDLDLGRNFFVSKYLSMRPFAGLRGVWIRQEQENVYLGMQAAPKFLIGPAPTENTHAAPGSFNTPDVTYFVENEEKYKAIGPRAGMDTLWSFGGGWGTLWLRSNFISIR